jgi:hypothetical protein
MMMISLVKNVSSFVKPVREIFLHVWRPDFGH